MGRNMRSTLITRCRGIRTVVWGHVGITLVLIHLMMSVHCTFDHCYNSRLPILDWLNIDDEAASAVTGIDMAGSSEPPEFSSHAGVSETP